MMKIKMPKFKASRKWLYAVYVPLLIAEWAIDMLGSMWKVFHQSVTTLILSLENFIHESTRPAAGK